MTGEDEVEEIIRAYETVVKGIYAKAVRGEGGRAYGGIVRAAMGELVPSIVDELTALAWKRLTNKADRFHIAGETFRIPIRREYVEKIANREVRDHIESNIDKYFYDLDVDRVVRVDGSPAVAIECKAYTENAMLKRVLEDFTLLKGLHPNLDFMLVQLESQLGGDYSELRSPTFGSPSTHTLLSHFDIDLHIVTLLRGERKVDRPIHKKEFFKPLTRENIENAVNVIEEILKKYV